MLYAPVRTSISEITSYSLVVVQDLLLVFASNMLEYFHPESAVHEFDESNVSRG